MLKDATVYVAGHEGLVGSAIVRALERRGIRNRITRTKKEMDLTDRRAVNDFFSREKPTHVFLAAAKVGGIKANITSPADFIRANLEIQVNAIGAAHENGVEKLLFLGSSCVYPRFSPQPMKEADFMTGPVEPTNAAYAYAKIAGIALCDAYRAQHGDHFISVMPSNVYGPNDHFDAERGHVVPGLMRRFHEAKASDAREVVAWGTGSARRELMHVDDLADGCLFCMETYDSSGLINIGTGEDVTIKELAALMAKTVGYDGAIAWDTTKPDGMPRKVLDVSKLHALGWRHHIALGTGLRETYEWFLKNVAKAG
jgi:GDP-L-fucose synthase